VRVVCLDLASNYRALVRPHFPNARIVADRFRNLWFAKNACTHGAERS
jgi:transposase